MFPFRAWRPSWTVHEWIVHYGLQNPRNVHKRKKISTTDDKALNGGIVVFISPLQFKRLSESRCQRSTENVLEALDSPTPYKANLPLKRKVGNSQRPHDSTNISLIQCQYLENKRVSKYSQQRRRGVNDMVDSYVNVDFTSITGGNLWSPTWKCCLPLKTPFGLSVRFNVKFRSLWEIPRLVQLNRTLPPCSSWWNWFG